MEVITPRSLTAMSEEQLKAFLEAVKADAGLQEKLKAAGDVVAVVEIAKAAGFLISAEDLQIAMAEVSEEELEGVAGGKNWWTTATAMGTLEALITIDLITWVGQCKNTPKKYI